MLRERELETAIAWVGLQLRFAQRHLAVAALDCDQHLPTMTGSSAWLQLCPFTRNRVGLIEFALKPKNTGETVRRRIRARIKFHCLPSLYLSFIKFTQISDNCGQQF